MCFPPTPPPFLSPCDFCHIRKKNLKQMDSEVHLASPVYFWWLPNPEAQLLPTYSKEQNLWLLTWMKTLLKSVCVFLILQAQQDFFLIQPTFYTTISHFLSTFFKHSESHVTFPPPPTQGNFFVCSRSYRGWAEEIGCCPSVPDLADLTACLAVIFIMPHSKQAQMGGFWSILVTNPYNVSQGHCHFESRRPI